MEDTGHSTVECEDIKKLIKSLEVAFGDAKSKLSKRAAEFTIFKKQMDWLKENDLKNKSILKALNIELESNKRELNVYKVSFVLYFFIILN